MKTLLIIYAGHSPTGSTATIANWLKTGAEKVSGIQATIMRAEDIKDVSILNEADGYLLGSGVYNGNPEPSFIEFSDNILLAGKSTDPNKVHLANKPFGVFCTSGGYATGAQPVLNAMARVFMTFNAVYIGGNTWHTGQGLCGIVKDAKPPSTDWDWDPYSKAHIQGDACDYGKRVALVTSFYNDAYTAALGGKKDTCEPYGNGNGNDADSSNSSCTVPIIVLCVIILVLLLVIFLCRKKK